MTFSILERGESFIQKRKKRRRFTVAFGCLAVVAAVGTGYALKRNGTAVNYEYRELTCTYEVHEHTDECYDAEGELICGKADYVIHVHNDDCYDKDGELVCTLPEIEAHQHEESCFEEMPVLICEEEGIEQNEISEEAEADNKTAVEEAQPPKTDNAAAFNGDVSGNDAAQTASNSEETADTEATGSIETAVEATPDDSRETAEASAENAADGAEAEEAAPADSSQETENTETSDGDTAAETTAADDSQLTNVSDEDTAADAATADEAAEAEPEISADAEESAEPEKPAEAEKPEVHVHTEECYELQQVAVCGQLELHKHTEECYDETGALICGLLELEEHVHDESCFEILEPAAGRRTFYGEDYTITVSYGVEAGLPEEVEFSAEEIKPGTAAYEEYRRQALDALGKEDSDITSGRIFDIRFVLNDEEIEPKATVDVEVSYQNEEPKILLDDPKVVHFAGEEEIPEVIDAEEREGTYTFSADSFSPTAMFLSEVNPEEIEVRIVDNIAGDKTGFNEAGCLYAVLYTGNAAPDFEASTENETAAKYEAAAKASRELLEKLANGYTVEFTWRKKSPGGTDAGFTSVARSLVAGLNQYDVAENGEWLNVALNEGAECEYKVQLVIKNGEDVIQDVDSGDMGYVVPYYDELKNGDFEAPEAYDENAVEDSVKGTHKQKIERQLRVNLNKYPGLIWKSTVGDIELVDIRPNGWIDPKDPEHPNTNVIMPNYKWFGEAKDASGGKQFAEINCDSEGALYQTVLTTPGMTLNWEFFHRARGTNQNDTPEYDEMYLVIMPENAAKDYDNNHQGLKNFLGIPDNSKKTNAEVMETAHSESTVYEGVNGVQIVRVVSDDQNWHQCNGIYTVPEGQYLTRFFFVAGRTSSESNSAGNFIDKIWFSTSMPEPVPAPEGKARLILIKIVEGLTKDELPLLVFESDDNDQKKCLEFRVNGVAGSGGTKTLSGLQFDWYWYNNCWVGMYCIDDLQVENPWESWLDNDLDLTDTEKNNTRVYRYSASEDNCQLDPQKWLGNYIAPDTHYKVWDVEQTYTSDLTGVVDGNELELDPMWESTGWTKGTITENYPGHRIRVTKNDDGTTTVTQAAVAFRNTYKSKEELIIKKEDGDNGNLLPDAKFEVSLGNLKETGTTDANGQFKLEQLGIIHYDKEYKLTEIEAPDGYVKLNEPLYFKITNKGTAYTPQIETEIYIYSEDGEKIAVDSNVVSANKINEGSWANIIITVKNNPEIQVVLPETGGTGAEYYRYISIALLAAGLIYGYSIWKKRERRAS